MKRLYTFTINKEEEVEVKSAEKDSEGKDVTVIKKEKQSVPYKFFLRKPNRPMMDDAELFYAKKLSENVKAGLISRALLVKRYENDGGPLSETTQKSWDADYKSLFKVQEEIVRAEAVKPEERTEEQKKELDSLVEQRRDIQKRIQDVEMNLLSLYDQTAESIARSRLLMWWTMMLAYKEIKDGKEEPLFGDGTYESRLEKYDSAIESEDKFMNDVIGRFSIVVPFWYVGRASEQADFDKVIESTKNS